VLSRVERQNNSNGKPGQEDTLDEAIGTALASRLFRSSLFTANLARSIVISSKDGGKNSKKKAAARLHRRVCGQPRSCNCGARTGTQDLSLQGVREGVDHRKTVRPTKVNSQGPVGTRTESSPRGCPNLSGGKCLTFGVKSRQPDERKGTPKNHCLEAREGTAKRRNGLLTEPGASTKKKTRAK